ncbi:hypothetical protein D1007_36684 [Hordeum vulgare]|uniref:Predicted protein n=2 Tax=Hordeum vulgare subsp. vulgare TaxID=112509 RepID=F2CUU0_HORVV|nr:serine/arginine repetitive matrix protein 2-like [Hordeum vulgare subsp. vulgare]KAE8789198.1 hypothetical protein D1007_36684 [Hordeum vulgare]BAJ86611.1 predicted protein [Hordeum vulgare subsp. vulgare]BAJ87859.1 predicted protein [Hordeum vulgare subsp. vulgare]
MAISDTSASGGAGARHVRCPRCRSVLQEPAGVPVYQCGGCGASLRAKLRSGDTRDASVSVSAAPSTESVLPSPRRSQAQGGSGDVASTSGTTPDAPSTSYRGAGTTIRRGAGDLSPPARTHPSSPVVEKKGRDQHRSADEAEAAGSSQPRVRSCAVSASHARAAPSSASDIPSPRRTKAQSSHLAPEDVASTSAPAPTPDVRTTSPRGADATSRRETGRETSGDQTPARKRHSSVQSPPVVEKKGHDHHRSANQEDFGPRRGRGAVSAPNAGANFAEMRVSERGREAEPETDAARKKSPSPSKAAVGEAAPMPDRFADSRSAPAVVSWGRRDDAVAEPVPAVAEGKSPSPPPRHAQKMSPLHEKILKTVDELKGDLSELFSQSPEAKPRTPPRPPRRPRQEGHAPHPVTSTSRARHAAAAAAALHHRGNAGKHGEAALRGLPSRRYRRCRADPCDGRDARPAGPCRRSCCDHVRPECGSCRGHCCRPSRAQEPARPAAAEAKKRAPPPKHHCRPVLKGAPFIVCSSCFTLVQVPAGFAVASAKVRDLRCGACSAVLSYSYRDPDRKKPADDQCSTAGSSPARHFGARPDLFSFIEDFAGASSYSTTEDEQPLHVSRNSSFDTVVAAGEETAAARRHSHSLHRLMGYGSASELLLRRSPSLYEYGSPDKRSTPPSDASRRHDDRKGKGICVDDFTGDEDSDDSATLRRSNGRRAGWRPGQGVPAGAIRIR